MVWTDEEERRFRELYWDHSYAEIAEILDKPKGTVSYHGSTGDYPDKTQANALEWRYGVPIDWLLDTLHNTLGKSAKRMADELDVNRKWLTDQMDDRGIPRRGRSEAEALKWEQMSEAEREQQVEAAHERKRELIENGEDSLSTWRRENPEKARELGLQAASIAVEYRETNGMKGVTGQDHPLWRGGKSVYDAVKKQLPGPSWNTIRDRHTADECRMCGAGSDLHLHHIVPIMAGGTNAEYNFMTLCQSCHKTAEWTIARGFDVVLAE